MSYFSLCAAALIAAAPPAEGVIQGKVSLIGLSVGSRADSPGEVVVYVEDVSGGELPKGPFTMEQRGKSFHPNLLIVPAGATVDFPNRDVEQHNVFSVDAKNAFDLALYETGQSRSVKFETPGITPLFCNIHSQMVAHVLVVTNGFYVRPRPDGTFTLRGVPEGAHTLVAWFPLGKTVRQAVKVSAGQTTAVELALREQTGADRHLNKNSKPYSRY